MGLLDLTLQSQKTSILAARSKLATAQQDLVDEINLTLKHFDRTLRLIEKFKISVKKKKKQSRRLKNVRA
jgi:hypothetical protein